MYRFVVSICLYVLYYICHFKLSSPHTMHLISNQVTQSYPNQCMLFFLLIKTFLVIPLQNHSYFHGTFPHPTDNLSGTFSEPKIVSWEDDQHRGNVRFTFKLI